MRIARLISCLVLMFTFCARGLVAGAAAPEPPKAPPSGFFQNRTPVFVVESSVSKPYTDKVTQMVFTAEQRFYQLFKLNPDLMNGTSKQRFDQKGNIPGDIMALLGFAPNINVRVHKDMEPFVDEWFERTNVKDKEQRLKQGIPGAWFSIHPDYDNKKMLREIRTFVANRDDDELERTLLHEMGHLFMHSYLLSFGHGPDTKQPNEKRGTPAWLSEGLAQFFEIMWSKASSAKKARMRDEAMIYEATLLGDSYPFKEFMDITNAHNLAAVAGNPLKATLNYAQSLSVMDYMINIDGSRFFSFLENLRAMNFEKNWRNKDKNHVHELFTFQNDAFKKAFNCDFPEVEQYWKKHVKTTMENNLKKQPELNYWIGEYYLRRGKDKEKDYAKAEEKFKAAMTLAPKSGLGYLGMGRMALRKKDNETALTTLTKASELLPKDDEVWYFLGMAQINNGKLTEAVASLGTSLKLFPRSARAHSGLGAAAFHAGQYAKSAEAYEMAYQISRNPIFIFEKGRSAFFGKDYRGAQTAFSVFCDAYPKDAQGHFWYGLSAWRLNDKEFGVKKMKEAEALNPADGMIKQALTLAEKGEALRFEKEQAEADVAAGKPADPAAKKPNVVVQAEDE